VPVNNLSVAVRRIKLAIAASLACAACVPAAFAAPLGDDTAQAPSMVLPQAVQSWHEDITRMSTPSNGCFQATFPSMTWEKTSCSQVSPSVHPMPRRAQAVGAFAPASGAATTGNGNDYAIATSNLIRSATGTFPSVTGVTSESSVGVAAFGNGGILGPNEYTLQVNTNADQATSACQNHSGCRNWQQFVYGTDYSTPGQAQAFIQYWLIGYGNTCPSGWFGGGSGSCYKNSAGVTAPNVPATQLAKLKLTGTATIGGNDTLVFTNGTKAYSLSASDSVLGIATVWSQADFNVSGDAGGAEADFNAGSSITVKIAAVDGTTARPSCLSNAGTTGETNNLNLGSCTASGGASPSVQFTQSN